MERRGGLGKGLGALIPAGSPDISGGLEEIEVAAIRPNPYQPREHFDEEGNVDKVGKDTDGDGTMDVRE